MATFAAMEGTIAPFSQTVRSNVQGALEVRLQGSYCVFTWFGNFRFPPSSVYWRLPAIQMLASNIMTVQSKQGTKEGQTEGICTAAKKNMKEGWTESDRVEVFEDCPRFYTQAGYLLFVPYCLNQGMVAGHGVSSAAFRRRYVHSTWARCVENLLYFCEKHRLAHPLRGRNEKWLSPPELGWL
jgi:hypothetical protein